MSAIESTSPPESNDNQESRRVSQWKRKIEAFKNPANLAETAYKDSRLTLEEFNDELFGVGYPVIMRVLEAEAASGDVKAIELFVKESKAWFATKRSKPRDDDKSSTLTPFVQAERKATE